MKTIPTKEDVERLIIGMYFDVYSQKTGKIAVVRCEIESQRRLKVLNEYWEQMMKAPAAKSHHSNYKGGLAVHTFNVLCHVIDLCQKSDDIDFEKIVFLALIHDIGKLDCYKIEDKVIVISNNMGMINPFSGIEHSGSMDHIFYTILRLQKIGIYLDEEEMNALVNHHGGWSPDS
ncbi:MAG: HD domain-containing protein, partial [Candidatus Hodarchaeales archaeon]